MNKTLNKLMIDIILIILFILLIYPRETGFAFHEIAGLVSGALVISHLVLNWSWVKNVTGNLFNPKLKAKTKLFYLLNTLSFVTLAVVIITGIQISTVLFPNHQAVSHNIILLHKWLSYVCLGLFGLHVALHWSFFVNTVPRMFKSPSRPSYGKLASNIGALILTLGLLVAQMGFNMTDGIQTQTQQETISDSALILNQTQAEDNIPPPNTSVSDPPTVDSTKTSRGKGRNAESAASSTITSINTTGSSSSTSSVSSNTSSSNQITLTQYLGNLFCTGCSKHCSLLSPQCSIGVSQAAAAKQEYTAIYGTSTLN